MKPTAAGLLLKPPKQRVNLRVVKGLRRSRRLFSPFEIAEAEESNLKQLLTRSEMQLADITEALEDALKLTEKPLETYLTTSDLGRRLMNQSFFSEIRVGADNEIQEATMDRAYARVIAPRLVRRRSHDDLSEGLKRQNLDPFSLGPRFDRVQDGAP